MARKPVSVSIESELIEKGRKQAKEEGRSFSNWVEGLIRKATKKEKKK